MAQFFSDRNRVIEIPGSHDKAEKELYKGLEKALQHYQNIESHWREYAESVGYPLMLDCSEPVSVIQRGLGTKRKFWNGPINKVAAHFAKGFRFGTSTSYILHFTSLRTIIDLLRAKLDSDNVSLVLIKPPQSGATTVMSAFGYFLRAQSSHNDQDIRWIECYPNDNAITQQAVSARSRFTSLYADFGVRLSQMPLSAIHNVMDGPGDTASREVHKNNAHFIEDFFSKIAGGEDIKVTAVEVAEKILSEQFDQPLVIAVDECQRGSGTNQVLGKQLITVARAVRERSGEDMLSFFLASATPYEVVHTPFAKNVLRVPCWVGENYSGPLKFEGIEINVLGDRSKVRPPTIVTWDEQFDLRATFEYGSVDYTISQKYGTGSDKTRFNNFCRAEYGMTPKQLKDDSDMEYQNAWDRFNWYDDYLEQVVPHCILNAFAQQEAEGHTICGVAIRLPNNNSVGHELVSHWNLPNDIQIIKCFDNCDLSPDRKRKLNPAELAEQAIKNGCKKFLIVHTGGGRMGVQFPSESRRHLETTSCTEETDPLLQAYHGRGCGHGKCSTYVGSEANVQHLNFFYATGRSPKSRPSKRSRRAGRRPTGDTYGWLMRKHVMTAMKKFVMTVDSELKKIVETTLGKFGVTPNEFKAIWDKDKSKNVKTTKEFSQKVIESLHPYWNTITNNPQLVCDLQEHTYVEVYPLRIAETAEKQKEYMRLAQENKPDQIPIGFLSEAGVYADRQVVAGNTIGLRFWPMSFIDPTEINVSGHSGWTSFKGTGPEIDFQIVWDFDDKWIPRFVALKFLFLRRSLKRTLVMADSTSLFEELRSMSRPFGSDGEYRATGEVDARIVKNGEIIIRANSAMAATENNSCPQGARELRRLLKENGCVKWNPGRRAWVFCTDVKLAQSWSLHIVGSAIHGSNRSADRAWRFIDV